MRFIYSKATLEKPQFYNFGEVGVKLIAFTFTYFIFICKAEYSKPSLTQARQEIVFSKSGLIFDRFCSTLYSALILPRYFQKYKGII